MGKNNQTSIVYESLKKRIEDGYYSPAESLPEIELATEYNVSRNTIKKALLMLEKDAFVSIEQNKGAKVRSYSKKEVLEFLELREELEGFIIRLTVPFIDTAGIQKLESLLDEMSECRRKSDLLGYSARNREFHSVIYGYCPNQTAVDFTVRLKNQMRKYNSKTILIPGRDDSSFQEHRDILDAIEKGDCSLAESCMRRHIHNVRDTFDQYYSLLF